MTGPDGDRLPEPGWAAPYSAWVVRTRSAAGLARLRDRADADPRGWAAAYARALALSPDHDLATAREAFAAVPVEQRTAADDFLHGQMSFRDGALEEVGDVLRAGRLSSAQSWTLATDMANPFAVGAGQVEPWLAMLSRPFVAAGLEPIVLDDSLTGADASPFTWLRSCPTSMAAADDLVTVVVSVYRPGPDLLTAVRSLTDQSWAALEILLVDDDSGPEFDGLIDAAAALDERVSVLRAARNSGTYAARNQALERARGRYVTFHDFDDWAHPRRIERQVGQLTGGRLASRSGCLRAFPDLTVSFPGYPAARLNASSLLIERTVWTSLVGGFDRVRKSGDMEYPSRLRAVAPKALRDLPTSTPLAITQLRAGSLSRNDSVPGWTHWERLAYRDAYREWHREIVHGQASGWIPVDRDPLPPTHRPALPQPSFGYPSTIRTPPDRADVVVVGDMRTDHTLWRAAAAELASLAAHGLDVALVDLDSAVRPQDQRGTLSRALGRLVNRGMVRWADPDAPLSVDTLMVYTPSCLLDRDGALAQWTVKQAILSVRGPDDLLSAIPEGGPAPDPSPLFDAARRHSPVVKWRPLTVAGRRALSGHTDEPVTPWLVSPRTYAGRRSTSKRLRIGHSVVGSGAWSVPAGALVATFPEQAAVDVYFAWGEKVARRAMKGTSIPSNWLFFQGVDGASDIWFPTMLDVMVAPVVDPDVVVAARETLAAGVPVVLPQSGRAVLAVEDSAVASLVTWCPAALPARQLAELAAADASAAVTTLADVFDTRAAQLLSRDLRRSS